MYSVSAEFLTAMNAPVQEHKVKGTIGSYTFGPGNILSGSFFVTNQCSENNMLGIGQVYIGELGATFRNVGISDGAWVGQIITPVFSLKTSNGWEDVPLGVYTVAEATISASGVTVKAYDNMTLFDKPFAGSIEGVSPYDVFSMACTACGVTMSTTRADIEAMANGTTLVSLTGTVETWRDVVAWMAQALGANATIDRSGYLRIFQYGSTSVATYDDAHRHSGASFADFVTRYTGISLTISATNTTYYYHDTPDDALTMELGANPFLQIGSDNDRQTACENILADLQAVQYSPFNVNLTGCPIYDLGDIITFEDGILSAQKTGCVTFFNYVNHAAYNIKGGGKNPAEASSKSRLDKVVGSLTQTVADQVNQMSVVQNAAAASIADGSEVSVLVYNFEVTEDDNLTMLDVSIAMTSSATETEVSDVYTLADIVAQLHFYVDGSEVSVYDPRFIVDEGKDTMTFNYSLSGLSVGAHEFDVRLEMDGGSGSIAVGDVHEMLWGYGITFEVYVKSIAVTTPPIKTAYYPGEVYDYTGIEVDALYNNGVLADISGDADYAPASGAVVPDEVGEVTVDVTYTDNGSEFTADFLVNVLEWIETDYIVDARYVRFDGTNILFLEERTNLQAMHTCVVDTDARTAKVSEAATIYYGSDSSAWRHHKMIPVGDFDVAFSEAPPEAGEKNTVAIFQDGELISTDYEITDLNGNTGFSFAVTSYYTGGGYWFKDFTVYAFVSGTFDMLDSSGNTIGNYKVAWLSIKSDGTLKIECGTYPSALQDINYLSDCRFLGDYVLYHNHSSWTGDFAGAGYLTADLATHTITKVQTSGLIFSFFTMTENGVIVRDSDGNLYTWDDGTKTYPSLGVVNAAFNATSFEETSQKYCYVSGTEVASGRVTARLSVFNTLGSASETVTVNVQESDIVYFSFNDPVTAPVAFVLDGRLWIRCPVQSPGGVKSIRYYLYDFRTNTYQKQSLDTE